MFEDLKYQVQPHVDRLKASVKKFQKNEAGMWEAVSIVQALVALIVIGAIGIYIADETTTITGTPAQANLSAMQTNVLSTGETGSSFLPILVIAFIGGIAMVYVFGMYSRKK